MKARMKATSYADIRELIGKGRRAKLGLHTEAALVDGVQSPNPRVASSEEVIYIVLHGSPIVSLYKDGRIGLADCGYPTQLTRDRMTTFIPPGRGYVFRSVGALYYRDMTGGFANPVHIPHSPDSLIV